MASFGEQLRQAREARNITLQEIAASTKISSRALQALESEHFEQLPGGIFNKGFVRAYARYVGLDEEKMLAAYMAAAEPDDSETDMQAISSQIAATRPAEEPRISGTTLTSILALIVALALGAVWLREHRKEMRLRAAAPAATATAPAPATAPAASANTIGETAPAAPPAVQAVPEAATTRPGAATAANAPATGAEVAPVEVSIEATQRAWISVHSDGKKIESVTLDPDKPGLSSRNYHARENLVLLTGNAAGLNVTYNGKPAGPLGKAGEIETITFTAKGMESNPKGTPSSTAR